jgi:hypothetical protein
MVTPKVQAGKGFGRDGSYLAGSSPSSSGNTSSQKIFLAVLIAAGNPITVRS